MLKTKVCKKCKSSYVPKYNEDWCNECLKKIKNKVIKKLQQ